MQKYISIKFITTIAICILLISACGQGDQNRDIISNFFFNVTTPGWDTTLSINNNPVCRKGSDTSSLLEVSPWMKEGPNSISIKTKRISESSSIKGACEILFYRVNATNPKRYRLLDSIDENPAESDNYDIEFKVNCKNRIKWIWQQSEPINEISEFEKGDIYLIIEKIADSLRDKNVDFNKLHFVPMWGYGPIPDSLLPGKMSQKDVERKRKAYNSKIFRYPDYTVKIAKKEDLAFVQGDKVVLVRKVSKMEDLNIIYAGNSDTFKAEHNKVVHNIGFETLRFIILDGKWTPLEIN